MSFFDIRVGDLVTFIAPSGDQRTGRALQQIDGGWALRTGGKNGTMRLVKDEDIVEAKRP